MRKNDNRSRKAEQKKGEAEEKDVAGNDETKKFIKRLEIQRKLLDNLMDFTTIQSHQTNSAVIITSENKPTGINNN
jgi:hypothetical protein